jgi:hypothetical protein
MLFKLCKIGGVIYGDQSLIQFKEVFDDIEQKVSTTRGKNGETIIQN